jgi:hypothetical protein
MDDDFAANGAPLQSFVRRHLPAGARHFKIGPISERIPA